MPKKVTPVNSIQKEETSIQMGTEENSKKKNIIATLENTDTLTLIHLLIHLCFNVTK